MSNPSGSKSRMAGYLPAIVGIVILICAGSFLPGMEAAGQLKLWVGVLVFVAGFFLLGVGLIRVFILLIERIKQGTKK